MRRMRRNHTAEFKAKVALEAIKGNKSNVQIAEEFDVHPVMVGQWRKETLARMPELFGHKAPVSVESVAKQVPSATETKEKKIKGFPDLVPKLAPKSNNPGTKLHEMERKVGELVMELLAMKEKGYIPSVDVPIRKPTPVGNSDVPPVSGKTILLRKQENKGHPEKDIRKTF